MSRLSNKLVVKEKENWSSHLCHWETAFVDLPSIKSSLVVVVQSSTLQFISTLPLDNSCAVHALILLSPDYLLLTSMTIHFWFIIPPVEREIVDYEQATSQVGHDSCFVDVDFVYFHFLRPFCFTPIHRSNKSRQGAARWNKKELRSLKRKQNYYRLNSLEIEFVMKTKVDIHIFTFLLLCD